MNTYDDTNFRDVSLENGQKSLILEKILYFIDMIGLSRIFHYT